MGTDDSEVLRRVAAACLSNNSAPHKVRQSKNAPRSLPVQAAISPPRATIAEGQVTPKASTPAPSFGADASSSAGPITERNVNTMVADNRSMPSLKGNSESLKV